MLTTSKHSQFHEHISAYELDAFHNPYLSKLIVKQIPKMDQANSHFVNPMDHNNNTYISQSIPMYRDESYRLAFVWKHSVAGIFSKSYFGFST